MGKGPAQIQHTDGKRMIAVSANAPLLQSWFGRTGHAHAADPYFRR